MNYRAQIFDEKSGRFVDAISDIFEQKHFYKNGTLWSDYEMVIQSGTITADQIALAKIVFVPGIQQPPKNLAQVSEAKQMLEIQGFTSDSQVLFKYSNPEQGVEQSFGVNLKYYQGHQRQELPVNKRFMDPFFATQAEKLDYELGDGYYIFKPEWRSPYPQAYGKLNEDVTYEKGQIMEQWSVVFDDPESLQKAIIKVRFSPLIPEFIDFNVEMNTVPINDGVEKDVTVNWKMYGNFDANRTFWTDSNGLEMEERNIRDLQMPQQTFAGNMYPVTSAIAMRDLSNNTNVQVTVLNDRSQAGSADLSDNSTIELMQHRRLLGKDDKGIEEFLNETDSNDDIGIQVNARYSMQIFDYLKGKSLQR